MSLGAGRAIEPEGRAVPAQESADFLVHSVQDEPVGDEFIALARARYILYCPTLFVIMGYRYALSGTWQPTEAEKRLADPQVLAGAAPGGGAQGPAS